MNEVTISLALSLKEAEAVCRFLMKADPLGVYTGGVVRHIDEEARRSLETIKEPSEKGASHVQ